MKERCIGTQNDTLKSSYYDGTKLLSKKDLNGNKPEIYLCTTNRSAGKTTYFNRLVTNRFKGGEGKFGLVYRFKYELDDSADKFFKDISKLFFNGDVMTSKPKASGMYHEFFLNDESCGYAMALNSADQLKKYSHFFNDIERMIFDEFQSESNHYCSDEVRKFISLHQSIARGNGKQSRYVPVYMMSNAVTINNPYFVELGISERLKHDTKFLRGNGFVLEHGFVESASNAQQDSLFNQAFSNNKYVAYASQNIYLHDEYAFIEGVEGRSRYFCTLKYKGTDFAVREYPEMGVVYCDKRVDHTNPFRISVTTADHNVNYVMLNTNSELVNTLRYYFNHGCFRFKDILCKEAVMKTVKY